LANFVSSNTTDPNFNTMHVLAAFLLAFGFSMLFLAGYRDKVLSTSYVVLFFLVLFMTGLAAQYWLVPSGPTIQGVAWMPLLFVITIVSLLFVAPSPYQNKRIRRVPNDPGTILPVTAGLFIWILLILLLILTVIGLCKEKTGAG
jgi:hypothetical protein